MRYRHLLWLARLKVEFIEYRSIFILKGTSMKQLTQSLSVKNTFFLLNGYFCSLEWLKEDILWAQSKIKIWSSVLEYSIHLNGKKNSWVAVGLQQGFLQYSEKVLEEIIIFKKHFMSQHLFDLAVIAYTQQAASDPDKIGKRINSPEYLELLELLTDSEKAMFFKENAYYDYEKFPFLFPKNELLSLFLEELLDNYAAIELWSRQEYKKQYTQLKADDSTKVGNEQDFIAWIFDQNYEKAFHCNGDIFLKPRKIISRLHVHWLSQREFVERYLKYTEVEFLKNLSLANVNNLNAIAPNLSKFNFEIELVLK